MIDFETLHNAMLEAAKQLRAQGLSVQVTVGPHSPRSVGLRAESDALLGELVGWTSGLASLTVVEANTKKYIADRDGIQLGLATLGPLVAEFVSFFVAEP